MFPRSDTAGLSPFAPEITVSQSFTVFSFLSEESEKRISLITSSSSSMTMLQAAKLCQTTVRDGSSLRLFTWESRRQLEEVAQAMNAVQVRYFGGRAVANLDQSGIWVNLYHPPDQLDGNASVAFKNRAWYRLPADVSAISMNDMKNVSGTDDGRLPASFLSSEAPIQSFVPLHLPSTSGLCMYLLWATSTIKRTAWLRDFPCDMHLDRYVRWAACESF